MIKTWYNTDVQTAASMLDVSDEKIRSWSNGRVTGTYYDAVEEHKTQGTMIDEEIFGKAGTESVSMGHIELPAPVLNIQYLYGEKPVLAKLLGMKRKDIAKLSCGILSVVMDPKDSGLVCGQMVSDKEKGEHPDAEYETGCEAVIKLLKQKGVPESGYILNCIPVLPVDLRVGYKDGKFCTSSLQMLYDRLLMRANRCAELQKIGAPEIILKNEKRLLQECVNSVINNGACGHPFMVYDGTVADSLEEVFHAISDITFQSHKMTLSKDRAGLVDETEFRRLYAELKKWLDEHGESPCTEYDEDGNIMEQNEGGRLEEEIKKVLQPLAEAVIDDNFADYKKAYHDDMIVSAFIKGLDFNGYKNGDDIVDSFAQGIFSRIDNFIRKRSMYKEVE